MSVGCSARNPVIGDAVVLRAQRRRRVGTIVDTDAIRYLVHWRTDRVNFPGTFVPSWPSQDWITHGDGHDMPVRRGTQPNSASAANLGHHARNARGATTMRARRCSPSIVGGCASGTARKLDASHQSVFQHLYRAETLWPAERTCDTLPVLIH
jgi:hypothetical protein